ncbi:MAG: MAPEG family protein [Alphaproteobacteria bacterium]
MSTELWLLTASGLLVVVQLALQSFTFKAQVGNAYTVGPRDEAIAPRGPAGRAERAFRNLLETLPVFAIAVIVIELAHKSDHWTVAGAHLYFWARIAFVAAYLWGVPWVRTLIWNASMIGLAIMYWRILA